MAEQNKKQELSKPEQLKRKHKVKEVFEISVEMGEGDTATGYIKKPDRKVMGAAMSHFQSNPLKANEIILNSCWLDGDRRILEDDDAFMAAGVVLEQVIQIRQAEIKKY